MFCGRPCFYNRRRGHNDSKFLGFLRTPKRCDIESDQILYGDRIRWRTGFRVDSAASTQCGGQILSSPWTDTSSYCLKQNWQSCQHKRSRGGGHHTSSYAIKPRRCWWHWVTFKVVLAALTRDTVPAANVLVLSRCSRLLHGILQFFCCVLAVGHL